MQQLSRCIVSISVRTTPFRCRYLTVADYASRVNASFFPIESWTHPALNDACKEKSPRFAKFWAIRYYLARCKRVLWIDDTIRFHHSAPNFFQLSPHTFYAAAEPVDTRRKRRRLKKKGCLYYNNRTCDGDMFNSGFMLFARPHVQMFVEAPRCERLRKISTGFEFFEDQPLFNALLAKHNFTWKDVKVVTHGSEIMSGNYGKVLHVTKATRKKRNDLLCMEDWQITKASTTMKHVNSTGEVRTRASYDMDLETHPDHSGRCRHFCSLFSSVHFGTL